ncbi:hypothetical protein ETAA8_16030 [Anatilimnocola aggregata]|uniref:Uncharacterized protein n=1 Tax=Anatilimnocola aggregata TaxID=2528021 RepID=A0A517Y8J7_9BACT|nr:hypothetical protein ETAA8_16030 [Anatilimnocola aggregata]
MRICTVLFVYFSPRFQRTPPDYFTKRRDTSGHEWAEFVTNLAVPRRVRPTSRQWSCLWQLSFQRRGPPRRSGRVAVSRSAKAPNKIGGENELQSRSSIALSRPERLDTLRSLLVGLIAAKSSEIAMPIARFGPPYPGTVAADLCTFRPVKKRAAESVRLRYRHFVYFSSFS